MSTRPYTNLYDVFVRRKLNSNMPLWHAQAEYEHCKLSKTLVAG